MKRYTRDDVVSRLRRTIARGESIVTAGSGIGLSAKFAEKGGADLVVVYNSGRYRMQGLTSWGGLLPIGDANGTMLDMGEREILPIVEEIPVIGGVFASDPTRVMDVLLDKVKTVGFAGVTNFPTVGLLEGDFRASLEQTGLGFEREVDMVKYARSIDLFTIVYVFTAEQATQMAEAGADCIVAHMGNTRGGSVGQEEGVKAMDLAIARTRAIAEACWEVNADIFVLCHGGPIALPQDAARVIAEAKVQGFVAASSIERLPVEAALVETTRAFKDIRTDETVPDAQA